MTTITLKRGQFGTYVLEGDEGRSVLVQTDWDFPGVASAFGWSVADVENPESDCKHDGTDGTVACKCGLTPTDFIIAAQSYLDDNEGAEVEDPGYLGDA